MYFSNWFEAWFNTEYTGMYSTHLQAIGRNRTTFSKSLKLVRTSFQLPVLKV